MQSFKNDDKQQVVSHFTLTLQDFETFYHLICQAAVENKHPLHEPLNKLQQQIFNFFAKQQRGAIDSKMLVCRISSLQNRDFFIKPLSTESINAIKNDIANGGLEIDRLIVAKGVAVEDSLEAIRQQYGSDMNATHFVPQTLRTGLMYEGLFEKTYDVNGMVFLSMFNLSDHYLRAAAAFFAIKSYLRGFYNSLLSLAILKKIPEQLRNKEDKDFFKVAEESISASLAIMMDHVGNVENRQQLLKYLGLALIQLLSSADDFANVIFQIQKCMVKLYIDAGNQHFNKKKFNAAKADFESAGRILERMNTPENKLEVLKEKRYMIDIYCTHARSYAEQGGYVQAIDCYQAAKDLFSAEPVLSTDEDQDNLREITLLQVMILKKNELALGHRAPLNYQPTMWGSVVSRGNDVVFEQEWKFTL